MSLGPDRLRPSTFACEGNPVAIRSCVPFHRRLIAPSAPKHRVPPACPRSIAALEAESATSRFRGGTEPLAEREAAGIVEPAHHDRVAGSGADAEGNLPRSGSLNHRSPLIQRKMGRGRAARHDTEHQNDRECEGYAHGTSLKELQR